MSFYDRYIELCRYQCKSPSRVATDVGLSKSVVTKWKKNPDVEPSGPTLKVLAEYFGVTVNELIYREDERCSAEDELNDYLDMLRKRPECRVLLSTAKNATKKQVEANIRVIDFLRGYMDVD